MSAGLVTALVGLASLALAVLLLPLLRRPRSAARDAYNLAVYRDQLAEVERDLARGLLVPEQAAAARAEIGRRILALGLTPGRPEMPAAAGGAALAAAVVAILLVPVAALLLYQQLGSPALPDQPFAARGSAAPPPAVAGKTPHLDMQQALAQVRRHLAQDPDDLTGWLLLARSELSLEHYAAAAEAYRHAADLSGHRADILGDWGEAQVLAAGGTVTPAARDVFQAALRDPESAPRSRYYLALAQLQQGDVKGALAAWRALAAELPADAAWLPLVRRQHRPGRSQARHRAGLHPPAAAARPLPPRPLPLRPLPPASRQRQRLPPPPRQPPTPRRPSGWR